MLGSNFTACIECPSVILPSYLLYFLWSFNQLYYLDFTDVILSLGSFFLMFLMVQLILEKTSNCYFQLKRGQYLKSKKYLTQLHNFECMEKKLLLSIFVRRKQ